MQLRHLSPSVIFEIKKKQPKTADFAISLDHRNLVSFIDSIKNKEKIINFAGLSFYKVQSNGYSFLLANGGVYAPDTAIATEIFSYLGARAIIRVGSCGALMPDLKIGDAILVDEIIDYTGVTKFYPGQIIVSESLNNYISKSLKNIDLHKGKICSYEALFQETPPVIQKMIAEGAIAVDMALAAFFKVADFCNMQAASILVVSDHLTSKEIGFSDRRFFNTLKKVLKQYPQLISYV